MFPTSTEDVVKLVKIANKYKMPVIPVSGATSLEGHYRAVRFVWDNDNVSSCFLTYSLFQPSVGGICVDMARMDKIIEVHGTHPGFFVQARRTKAHRLMSAADSDVICQPGIRWMDLNETLKKQGDELPLTRRSIHTPTNYVPRPSIVLPCKVNHTVIATSCSSTLSLTQHRAQQLAVC